MSKSSNFGPVHYHSNSDEVDFQQNLVGTENILSKQISEQSSNLGQPLSSLLKGPKTDPVSAGYGSKAFGLNQMQDSQLQSQH